MTIDEMKQKKQELGYSYEMIAVLADLPVVLVREVFDDIIKMPSYDVLNALETVFISRKEEEWKNVNMIRETQPAYMVNRKQGEYTIEDYYAFPDDYRVELIDGVIYDMSAPSTFHQALALDLCSVFKDYIRSQKGKCISLISSVDVQLDCDDKTIVQPDVMIVCDRDKLKEGRVYGAPDLVVEVLSPSTARKDRYIKLSKYMRAGVRECWLVDPVKKRIYVHEWKDNDTFIETYTFDNEIPVGIFGGECKVNFREIYEYVEFLYET